MIQEKLDKVTIDFNDSVLKLNLGNTAEQDFLDEYSSGNIVIDKNAPFKTSK